MKCTVIFDLICGLGIWGLSLCLLLLSPRVLAQEWPYTATQKKIIAELSGHAPLPSQVSLSARSSRSQREHTRKYLSLLIEDLGLEALRQEYVQPNIHPLIDLFFDPFRGANIYTVLLATQPSEEYIVIGAHMDTERNCPGAIDNGSGIALIYTVLQQMQAFKTRKRNLIVIFFDQEEEELNGSRAFAQYIREQKMNVYSVHTFDTIAWDGDGDQAVEVESPNPLIDTLYRRVGRRLQIPVYTTQVIGSDHEAFREFGFEAVGLTDELVGGDFAPYKDTPQDTYETVNFDYLASSSRLVYEVIKILISAEEDEL